MTFHLGVCAINILDQLLNASKVFGHFDSSFLLLPQPRGPPAFMGGQRVLELTLPSPLQNPKTGEAPHIRGKRLGITDIGNEQRFLATGRAL